MEKIEYFTPPLVKEILEQQRMILEMQKMLMEALMHPPILLKREEDES